MPRLIDDLRDAYEAYQAFGSERAAADALGLAKTTFHDRLREARQVFEQQDLDEDPFITPVLPSEETPVDELIDRMVSTFERKRKAREARRWIPVKVETDKPIGLAFLGDPHIDDPGCDWPTLKRHLDIINKTSGMRSINIGDTTNNWVGRLARLYADQETTQSQAWQLTEWFIREANFMLIINGNHDMWSGASDPIQWMKGCHQLQEDWTARVELQFKNGKTMRFIASHDFPGHSQWNPLHANMKMAKFLSSAHLYIAGHRHNWALSHIELPESSTCPWLARARGYKFFDHYALTKGYEEQQHGHSIGVIIDPNETNESKFVQCFADLEEAADYLTFKRRKYA